MTLPSLNYVSGRNIGIGAKGLFDVGLKGAEEFRRPEEWSKSHVRSLELSVVPTYSLCSFDASIEENHTAADWSRVG